MDMTAYERRLKEELALGRRIQEQSETLKQQAKQIKQDADTAILTSKMAMTRSEKLVQQWLGKRGGINLST